MHALMFYTRCVKLPEAIWESTCMYVWYVWYVWYVCMVWHGVLWYGLVWYVCMYGLYVCVSLHMCKMNVYQGSPVDAYQ